MHVLEIHDEVYDELFNVCALDDELLSWSCCVNDGQTKFFLTHCLFSD